MSFARNFALGQQIAQTALDAYERSKERARLREAQNAAPQELRDAYTDSDAQQLHAIANARDASGNPYYTLEAKPDGAYGLRANFAYQGSDGQQVPVGQQAAVFAPRASTMEFLGRRYDPQELTPDRVDALRMRKMAGILSERDPVLGLQMRRALAQDERDATKFDWERQAQPLRQRGLEMAVESSGLQLDEQRRLRQFDTLFGKYLQEYDKLDAKAIGDAVKLVNGSVSITIEAPNKTTGLSNVSVVKPDGNAVFFSLNKADQAQLYAASKLLQEHPRQAIEIISRINKDLAAEVAREAGLTLQAVGLNNRAAADAADARYKQAQLNLSRERLNQERTLRPSIVQLENDAGEPVIVDANRITYSQDGAAVLPQGLRLPRSKTIMSPSDRAKYEQDLIMAGTPKEIAYWRSHIAAGTIKPADEAAQLAKDPPKRQAEQIEKWKLIDPLFAAAVAAELSRLTAPAQASPPPADERPARGLLPPPIIRRPQGGATEPVIPQSRRGPVGQGLAVFPWEVPTGGW